MDQNSLTMILVGIAVASSLIALGVVLYPRLRNEKQGYPFEAQIEAALLPLVFQGICAAYRTSEKGVEDFHQKISGLEKKKIADSIYAKLPEKIGTIDLIVIKRIVPQERFEVLVQNTFDNFDNFYQLHHHHFEDLFEKWKASSMPADSAGQPASMS
jgi:hypothetical protein